MCLYPASPWCRWLFILALTCLVVSPACAATRAETLAGYIQQLNDPARAGDAGRALCQAGIAAVEPLCTALRDKDPVLRAHAAEVLQQLNTTLTDAGVRTQVAKALLIALRDEVAPVRRAAAAALIELKDPQTVEGLIAALFDADSSVAASAATALGGIGDARALSGLLKQTMSTNEGLRLAAAKAVGQLGEAGLEPLLALLKYPDANMRQAAVCGLGWSKQTRAIAPVLGALLDEAPTVRASAVLSLQRLQETLPTAPEGNGIVAGIAAAITDKDVTVRLAVLRALCGPGHWQPAL